MSMSSTWRAGLAMVALAMAGVARGGAHQPEGNAAGQLSARAARPRAAQDRDGSRGRQTGQDGEVREFQQGNSGGRG